ncbi:MAG: thioesterase family protein [Ilumatobacteraceae bacterium]
MSDFDKAIHVAPDGSSEIVAGWDIGGNANGGYLLALIANHMRALSGRPDPITVTGHYLSPGVAGPVQIDGEVIKSGKRFATVTATMHRDGRPMLQALGTFGDVAFGSGSFEHVAAQPPDLPAIQECVRRSTDQGGTPVPMMEHLDVFIRPADAGFITGTKSGVAEMAGWFAFPDGHVVDTLALLMVCDALPPGVFNLDLPAAWVPTVEYTVHVRGVPAAGPLRCIFRSEAVSNGFLQEDGEVWDSAGQLVAMSRQLALMAR